MSISSVLRNNFAHPIILCVLALILVPVLFLPLGIDQSIFARGSEVLFNGGKLYVDYFEQKPPLLFVFYGIGGQLFGHSDISYRFFDFLWQLFTVLSLLYCVQRLTGNKIEGLITSILYAILYSSMGNSETMECESFIAPALVWLLYFTASETSNTPAKVFLRGILAGFIFGLKFTFGVVFATLLLWELMESKERLLQRFLILTLGFTIAAVCSLWAFFDTEVLYGYMRVFEYTRVYAGTPALNVEFIRHSLILFGHFFGDNISLTITVTAVFGLVISLKNYSSELNNQTEKLIRISIMILIAFFLSIVIERKFNPYHFLRIFIPLSILTSFGMSEVITFLRRQWHLTLFSWKVVIMVLICSGLFMSPIPRYIKNIRPIYSYFISKDSYWAIYQSSDDPVRVMVDIQNIATYIRTGHNRGRTFAFSIAASQLYRQLDEHPISKFSMPMYYYSTFSPKGAYQEMLDEVKQAHWLVMQHNDVFQALYGHTKSSWECVRTDSTMFAYLNENFTKVKEIGAFYVFERNE